MHARSELLTFILKTKRQSMSEAPILYAGLTLVIALGFGLLPLFSSMKDHQDRLKTFTSIAAGIILASAMLIVIPEGYELATHEESVSSDGNQTESKITHTSELVLGGALLAGFLFMLILEGSGIGHAVHEEHHDHDHEHGHVHVHHNDDGWMVVLGLTLHSLTDGIAIGAAAATGNLALTATVAIAVLIHKAPAAFSLGVFSLHERRERKKSIQDVLIFSLSTPVMMMLAYLALSGLETQMIGLAMLFSAGTFLYVATVDTLPDMHNPETGKKALMHVLIGVLLLSILLVLGDNVGLLEHAH